MVLTIWLPTAPFAGLGFFLLGAGPILWVISTTTLRQTATPPDLLGRVSAINIMAYGARPIGSALGALLGGLFWRRDLSVGGRGWVPHPGHHHRQIAGGQPRPASPPGVTSTVS
jgi:predicted MFS family arabinose efflux permease